MWLLFLKYVPAKVAHFFLKENQIILWIVVTGFLERRIEASHLIIQNHFNKKYIFRREAPTSPIFHKDASRDFCKKVVESLDFICD